MKRKAESPPAPAPFALLQQRIGRKNLTKKILADAPVSFMAYDLLEQDGADVRGYFHWTNTDNFEWARGYAAHFGLIGVDRKTLERTVKPSGRLYARIAAANGLD